MSLQRKINRSMGTKPRAYKPTNIEEISGNRPDKGKENGSCNRTACQRPLEHEPEHQFMDGNFTGGPKLFYCSTCAYDFDKWDRQSGDLVRIKREPKA